MSRRSPIHLHIEELVLDGFPSGDRHRIADAMQVELTRLLTEKRAPACLTNEGAIGRVDAGSFQTTPGARPAVTGTEAARAIFGGLKQ